MLTPIHGDVVKAVRDHSIITKGLSNKFYSYQQATPSNSPLRRGRVDYQAVSPPVQGGIRGGSY